MRRESTHAIYFGLMGCVAMTLSSGAPAALIGFDDQAQFEANSTDLVKEDFESGPWLPPGPLTQPVQNLGITWSSAEMLRTDTVVPFAGERSLFAADEAGDPTDEISAEIEGSRSAIGFFIGNAGNQNSVEVLVYGPSDEFIGSEMLDLSTSSLGEYRFFGVVTEGEIIRRVTLRSLGGINDEFIIDDFMFGQRIPAAPAMGLFLAAGLLGSRRRRA